MQTRSLMAVLIAATAALNGCSSTPSTDATHSFSSALFTSTDRPMGQGSQALAWLTGDVNGDGKTDVIQPWDDNHRLGLIAYFSDGTGYGYGWGTGDMGEGSGALAWLTGDVNGDHKTDVIQPFDNGGRLGMIVYASNGAGFNTLWGSGDMGNGSGALTWLTGDVNGDGKTDVIQPFDNGGRLGLITYLSNGSALAGAWGSGDMGNGSSALAWLTGDVDGDGKTDILQPFANANGRLGLNVYRSNGGGYTSSWSSGDMGQGSGAIAWLVGDVNGDHKTDLIQAFDNGGRLGMIVYVSNGTGYAYGWGTGDIGQGSSALAFRAGDVNGDGLTDVVQTFDNGGYLGVIVYTATGSGSLAYARGTSNLGHASSALAWLTGSVSGAATTNLIEPYDMSGRLGIRVEDLGPQTCETIMSVQLQGAAVINDRLRVGWTLKRPPQPAGYGTPVTLDGVQFAQWYLDDGTGYGNYVGPAVTANTPATHTFRVVSTNGCPDHATTISLPPQQPTAAYAIMSASPTTINAGQSATLRWYMRQDPTTGCYPITNKFITRRVSDGAVLSETTPFISDTITVSPSSTTDYSFVSTCVDSPSVSSTRTVRINVATPPPPPPNVCYPGYAGASSVVVSSSRAAAQTIWLNDLDYNTWNEIGTLGQGQSLTVSPIAAENCHRAQIVAVDTQWVSDYNASFGTSYSADDPGTAQTLNFQSSVTQFIIRTGDPQKAITVF